MSFQYKKNRYQCGECGGNIITIDRDCGTTPFLIACRMDTGCGGKMESSLYRNDQDYSPTHEWFKPESLNGLKDGEKEHCKMGGLLLREIQNEK